MITTSERYKQIVSGNPNWNGKVKIILANGITLMLTNSNIWAGGIDIEYSTSNENEFNVGSANIGQLTVIINNDTGDFTEYDFTGATLIPYVGLDLEDGTVEWLQKGVFVVDEPITTGNRIKITALDNMSKFDVAYSESTLVYPATLAQIIGDACAHCGVELATASFLNSSYMVETRPDDSAITFRDIVSFVAQLAGCYAKMNQFGSLELGWYQIGLAIKGAEADLDGGNFIDYEIADDADGGNFTYYKRLIVFDGGLFVYPDGEAALIDSLSACSLQTDTIKVTGVQITPKDTSKTAYISGKSGYVISIRNNPLAQDNIDQLVANIGNKLNGFEFLPLSISCVGRPDWEAGDVCVVTYKGYNHTAIISNLKYIIREYENISSDAESEQERNTVRYSDAAKAVATSKTATEKEFVAYDAAVRNLNALMANALGFYQITETQSDGTIIEYMCDKPTLAESTIIWKRTIEGFTISTDGGQTWSAGFTANGNAVVKVLTALGINADWINAGHLSADYISGGTIDATNVTVKNLDAGSITTGEFNADLIKTGKIQSKDGSAYFDLDNNKIAAKEIVDDSGQVLLTVHTNPNTGNPSVYTNGYFHADNVFGDTVACSSLQIGGSIITNFSSHSMRVVTDVQLQGSQSTGYSLWVTHDTINYMNTGY